jgi:RNA polymerase sigma-70 factor (ECF subfamily)
MAIDPARFEQVLRAHEGRLRAILARGAGGRPGLDVDDLVQEARIRLWKALEGERTVDAVASYVQRIATSVLIDALRRRSARPEDATEDPAEHLPDATVEPPEADMERKQKARALAAAIDALPERRRLPTRLLLQGFTTLEIARLTASTEATVRNLAYRGVEALKAKLSGTPLPETDDD